MADFFIAISFILILLSGWTAIQHLARRYAARHPELGPAKEEGSGCGQSCLCGSGYCKNKDPSTSHENKRQNLSQNHQENPLL